MGGRGLMPTIHSDLSIPELIKHIKHSFRESEYDEVRKTLIERENNTKIEIENLMRDRDLLKKDIDFLENTLSYTELEKCSVEEKLGMCQRRCEELDKEIVQMGEKIRIIRREKLGVEEKLENSNRKCEEMDEKLLRMGKEIEELRWEKIDANRTIEELKQKMIEADRAVQELNCKNVEASETIDELRVQKMESDNAAEVYKRIVRDSFKKILKLETQLSKMSSVNVEDFPNLVNVTDNCAATFTDSEKEENVNVINFVEDGIDSLENGMVNADGDAMSAEVCATCGYARGSGGIGLSKKGCINLAHPGTKEDGANVVCTCSCSVPAYNSDVSESCDTIPDNEGQEPEVEVAKLIVEDSTNVEKREKKRQTKLVFEDPAVGEKRKRLMLEEEEKKLKRITGPEEKKEKKSKTGEKGEKEVKEKSNIRRGATGKWVSKMASFPDSSLENEVPRRPLHQLTGQIHWLRQPLQRLSPSIVVYARPEIVETIRATLHTIGGDDAVQSFKSGCFGYFLDYKAGEIQKKVIHSLMSREVCVSDRAPERRESWFQIHSSQLRFGPCEYNLVSGLRFGSSTFDPNGEHVVPPRAVYHRLFHGQRTTIRQMEERFLKMSMARDASASDYVKVANILFAYRMILCLDHNRYVDPWVWALVEDVERWNSFPWGTYSYQMLMHFISLLPMTRQAMGGKGDGQYHFYGPIWALQIWACEVMPDLAREIAVHAKQLTLPRCLRWIFRLPTTDMRTLLQGSLRVVSLVPSSEETATPYYRSMQLEGGAQSVKFVVTRRGNKKKMLANSSCCSTAVAGIVGPLAQGTRAAPTPQKGRQASRTLRDESDDEIPNLRLPPDETAEHIVDSDCRLSLAQEWGTKHSRRDRFQSSGEHERSRRDAHEPSESFMERWLQRAMAVVREDMMSLIQEVVNQDVERAFARLHRGQGPSHRSPTPDMGHHSSEPSDDSAPPTPTPLDQSTL